MTTVSDPNKGQAPSSPSPNDTDPSRDVSSEPSSAQNLDKAAHGKKDNKAQKRVSAVGAVRVTLARIVLFWERAWPGLVPMLGALFLFIILSLFGVWRIVPAVFHWAAIALTAGAVAYAGYQGLSGVRWPTRREALARLEEDGAIKHAALQTLEDTPFDSDATGENPLWRAHLEEMREKARAARLRKPHADADRVDPFALRYGAIGLLAIALVAAGDERGLRISEGFSPRALGAAGISVADVWIEPPAYTGLAPIYLLKAGDDLRGVRDQVNAPEGSTVIAQISGDSSARRFELSFLAADNSAEDDAASLVEDNNADQQHTETNAALSTANRETVTLARSGVLQVRLNGADTYWPIGIVADTAPSIRFLETPSTTDDARLAIAVAIDDDYGVAKASLKLTLDPDQERPLDAPEINDAALSGERIVSLDGLAASAAIGLGGARSNRSGERRFDLDLQSDPWAGLEVIGVLSVTDGAGQSASTQQEKFRLPAREFFNPLAKSVIEQRQTLAVAASEWSKAWRAFDALTLAPEAFYDNTTDYLLLRTAYRRVLAKQGQDFDETVEEFWPLALQLEDKALELARRRLQAAEDALREALERGASADEINKLVENLRTAMNQYLQALAQSGQAPPQNGQSAERLEQGDLDQMLDSIRDLAQSGAENAARQALSELENILNNLRMSGQGQPGQPGQQGQPGQSGQGQPGQGGSGQGGQGGQGNAGEAGDLIGRQRDLANRSFQQGQSGSGQPGAGQALSEEQRALSNDLNGLRDALRNGGSQLDPDGDAGLSFDSAARAMDRAQSALQDDNFEAANSAMERAIANLRDGAETLAENAGREARAARQGQSGQGEGPATDPLGRPIGNALNGNGVDVPEELDYQRARDVLKELRRRLSDGERTEEEIEYLERLLERF